jgi:pimeloyl-ACP methyl ester carboxylesterase
MDASAIATSSSRAPTEPGSSGSPVFEADTLDLIAFDQRGTGLSRPTPMCVNVPPFGADTALTRANLVAFYRTSLTRCFGWWEEKGIDIDGYTTIESAHDLEDLRRALGARKLNLWGISYG